MARGKTSMLGTGLRYFLTVLFGMSVSMLIAYVLVRALTQNTTHVEPPGAAAVEHGWSLRVAANELTRLSNEFADTVPPGTLLTPNTERWLRTEFRTQLSALRRDLSEDQLEDLPPTRALIDATARLDALANHADDAALRDAVSKDIRAALGGLEEYLRANHLNARIALPITPLR